MKDGWRTSFYTHNDYVTGGDHELLRNERENKE